MLISNQSHSRLLWAAHLLSAFVLPAVFVFLIYRRPQGYLPMYVFWTWEKLAALLPVWVAVLLGWRLWQRGQAAALVLLVGFDVLVLFGYQLALFVSSMTADPI